MQKALAVRLVPHQPVKRAETSVPLSASESPFTHQSLKTPAEAVIRWAAPMTWVSLRPTLRETKNGVSTRSWCGRLAASPTIS